MFELRVHTRLSPASTCGGRQQPYVSAIQRMLLTGIDAPGNPTWEHERSTWHWTLPGKFRLETMVLPCFTSRSSPDRSETRPQTETSKVQPAHFVTRGFLSPKSNFEKHFGESANRRDRPRISPLTECCFHLADQSIRCNGIAIPAGEDIANHLDCRFESEASSVEGKG